MINNFDFFHGIVFSRLLHAAKQSLSIKVYPTKDNASYVIDGRVGLYIKYSAKRLTPWTFTFNKEHQDEILAMRNSLENVFILFVCNDNGIACLDFDELKIVLNEVHEEIEWVRIARRKRHEFAISGKDGELDFKVPLKDFQRKILEALESKPIPPQKRFFTWFK